MTQLSNKVPAKATLHVRVGEGLSANLARLLRRDYKNVHADVAALSEWLAIQRESDGRVSVPWSEIVVDMKLPAEVAA